MDELPIEILENVITVLDDFDKLNLKRVNKYFNSIVSPILYKGIFFEKYFKNSQEFYDTNRDNLNFSGIPSLGLDEESNSAINERRIHEVLNESISDLSEVKFRQNLWTELEPIIKKYRSYIKGAQSINPNNLGYELESFNNLRRYELNIDTQEGLDQLKIYNGNKFEKMELLRLFVDPNLEYRFRDFFRHLVQLKGLELDLEMFDFDVESMSCFKSDILTYLHLHGFSDLSTNFFQMVHRNYKNLRYLDLYCHIMSWSEDSVDFPVFENLNYFSFDIVENVNPRILNYIADAKFWPNIKTIYGDYPDFRGSVEFKGKWKNLVNLSVCFINPNNFNQGSNFYHLKILFIRVDKKTSKSMLQSIFTNLTNLKDLKLTGHLYSQRFDFQPKIQLRKLHIAYLANFSLAFITFIKALFYIRILNLNFCYGAFDRVDLPLLLKDNHHFFNLVQVPLKKLPVALQQWFLNSMK